MNPITKLMQDIPDEELKAMCIEVKDLRETGILLGGKVQALARKLSNEYNIDDHDARTIAREHISVEAARRWVEDDAEKFLRNLTQALQSAFISSWQSTHAWQSQLDAAREYLNKKDDN